MFSYHDGLTLEDIRTLLEEIAYSLNRVESLLSTKEEISGSEREREKEKERLIVGIYRAKAKNESRYDSDEY